MSRQTRRSQRGAAMFWWLIGIVAAAGLLLTLYVWVMLRWSYSSGERAGWVQKLSKKGYLCKTWEGEMAMVSLPGSVPEKFLFTVWDDATAAEINQAMGRRVSLYYEEHIWLPTNCLGDTRHFVKRMKVIESEPAPMDVRSIPGAQSSQPSALPGPEGQQGQMPQPNSQMGGQPQGTER